MLEEPTDSDAHQWLIVTDLDGTLLDHNTYWPEGCELLLRRVADCGIPLIPCTSKTAAETRRWRERLGLHDPFIVENGAAIHFETADSALSGARASADPAPDSVIVLGRPYVEIRAAFAEIKEETGLPLEGFADWSKRELSVQTGLSLHDAELAARREFTEPFLSRRALSADERKGLENAVRRRGLRLTEGGRFLHLTGAHDKGLAVERLVQAYEDCHPETTWRTIGLGDSPNDAPMLRATNLAILVRSPGGEIAEVGEVSDLRITRGVGPSGWKEAVEQYVFSN